MASRAIAGGTGLARHAKGAGRSEIGQVGAWSKSEITNSAIESVLLHAGGVGQVTATEVVREGEEAWEWGYAPKRMVSHASSPLQEGGSLGSALRHLRPQAARCVTAVCEQSLMARQRFAD